MTQTKKKLYFATLVCTFVLLTFVLLFIRHADSSNEPVDKMVNRAETQSANPEQLAFNPPEKAITNAMQKKLPGDLYDQPQNAIYDCSNGHIAEITDADDLHDKFLNELSHSSHEEHQLAYILFQTATDLPTQFQSLYEHQQSYPNNPFVMMEIVGMCSVNTLTQYCQDELIAKAMATDVDNGAMWLQAANFYLSRGNKAQAVNALENAIQSTTFNDYYFESLKLFMDSSKRAMDASFTYRAMAGFDFFAAKPLWKSHLHNFCLSEKDMSKQESYLCLELGKILEHKASLAIENSIGLRFQEIAHQHLGDEASLKAIIDEAKSIEASSAPDEAAFYALMLKVFDESLFHSWLENSRHYGEKKAQAMLIDEAVLLSRNAYYNPCPTR